MEELLEFINKLGGQSFEGWSEQSTNGYKTSLFSIRGKLLELKEKKVKQQFLVKFRYQCDYTDSITVDIEVGEDSKETLSKIIDCIYPHIGKRYDKNTIRVLSVYKLN